MTELTQLGFDEVYRRVFPMILSKCRRMLSGSADAQDLAQEVFVRLWQSREKIAEPRALTAWLYCTCTRLAIDRARSRGRQDEAFAVLSADAGGAHDAADPEVRSAGRRMLKDLVAQTPDRELEVALLSRIDGLNQEEIAEVLDMGERTVRRLLARFAQRFEHARAAGGRQ
jgi:RNA polymerase sigma-70 factor (ECF subfamily)